MSGLLVDAFVNKASLRADELQVRGNNVAAMAKLLRQEDHDITADELETLAKAYHSAADTLRQAIRSVSVIREPG